MNETTNDSEGATAAMNAGKKIDLKRTRVGDILQLGLGEELVWDDHWRTFLGYRILEEVEINLLDLSHDLESLNDLDDFSFEEVLSERNDQAIHRTRNGWTAAYDVLLRGARVARLRISLSPAR